jgi:hypothetical protein
MNIKEKLTLFKQEQNARAKEFRENSKNSFNQFCREVFDAYPELESFNWWQGDYFNDETTEFVVQFYPDEDSVILSDESRRDEIQSCLELIMKSVDEHVLNEMFGDYSQVTMTRKGSSIEECSGN